MHTLEANHLAKTIKKAKLVHDISLNIKTKEVVGLLGPNGAGKTTTFYMICGLATTTGGNVLLDGKDITQLPLSSRAKLGIGYLPQESSIFKDLTVEENLQIAGEALGLDESSMRERIEKLLEIFNIEPIRNREGIRLSGGERRRVEIARSLMGKPKFLLLDEPFAGVDPIAVLDIQNIIKQLVELDMGILITDHNVRETLGICDRAYVMRSGEMMAYGTSEEIIENEDVKKYYLGENFSFNIVSNEYKKELIKSKSLKFTPARESLLEIFEKLSKPISYEDIKDSISMDKATFYRNMSAFEKIGILKSFESNDKKRYYELSGSMHAHLICTKCNSIECLHDIPQELFNDPDIEGITIHGKCKKCKQEN